jgi:hypothetical protein
MFANLKCLGLHPLVPLKKKKKMGVMILGTKILRSSQQIFFKMMTKLLSLEVRLPLKNVLKNELGSQHSTETLKKNNTQSK